MLLLAIIGILAGVIIISFGNILERTREAVTKGNLSIIRSGIKLYYAEYEGVWPDDLTGSSFLKVLELQELPYVRVTQAAGNQVTNGTGSTSSASQGWYYDNSAGNVFVNSTALDTKGFPYSSY